MQALTPAQIEATVAAAEAIQRAIEICHETSLYGGLTEAMAHAIAEAETCAIASECPEIAARVYEIGGGR